MFFWLGLDHKRKIRAARGLSTCLGPDRQQLGRLMGSRWENEAHPPGVTACSSGAVYSFPHTAASVNSLLGTFEARNQLWVCENGCFESREAPSEPVGGAGSFPKLLSPLVITEPPHDDSLSVLRVSHQNILPSEDVQRCFGK